MLLLLLPLLLHPWGLLAHPSSSAYSSSLKASMEEGYIDPYVPLEVLCEINGFTIPAMIDTGAQISVMSQACAERCLLADQIDTCYGGRAVGVGTSEISGRIHNLPLRIGPLTFQNRIAILKKSRVDFIIGLDFLRKHKCEVNIQDNSIRINVQNRSFRIPFVHDLYDEIKPPMRSSSPVLDEEDKLWDPFSRTGDDSLSTRGHDLLSRDGYDVPEYNRANVMSTRHENSESETFSNWDEYDDSNEEFVSMEGV